ncbi:alanine dehydrogenase [Jonesia quinghaiensis]|uniref:alanine dehydrogenase n=1 Tax=Jonesia quinghaiensis TaxID=262806 RepID=UPI000400F613|nr:alanine dehydrogenase [Jonesia quinghaiensis]
MRIGVPTEIKNNEYRVAITPAGVYELTQAGHEVWVQTGAGVGSGILDSEYRRQGAHIIGTASEVWQNADTLLKVKEPIPEEYGYLREDLVLFTYLHLAADTPLTTALLAAGTTAIAYETVQLPDQSLPLLAPMSEVAGRLGTQVGAYHLMKPTGGRGILMGGVPGTSPARVVVIGGGVAGTHAAESAIGMGANVTILDVSLPRLRSLEARFQGRVHTALSSQYEIGAHVVDADLVIGSVLIPGASAPKLVTDDMVSAMKKGAVLVDIAIDQGGCFEHSHPTTHDSPVFSVHDTLYYCVANMPGAVPFTSTQALTNASLPYVMSIASHGWAAAVREDSALAAGVNTHGGAVVNPGVAQSVGKDVTPLTELIGLS